MADTGTPAPPEGRPHTGQHPPAGAAGAGAPHPEAPAPGAPGTGDEKATAPGAAAPPARVGRGPLWYLLPFGVLFLVLGVVLFFIRPWAPLLLLASLAIQLPIIIGLTKTNLTSGYRDRAFARMQRYQADGDAAAWLAEEEREAASVGQRYWSRAARDLCVLNRAQPLALLGRKNEAAQLLAGLEPERLNPHDHARFNEIVEIIQEETHQGEDPDGP